jgi:hypothetical protein
MGRPGDAERRGGSTARRDVNRPQRRQSEQFRVRLVTGDQRAQWWERAVAAYPPYVEAQARTEREFPIFVATRKG